MIQLLQVMRMADIKIDGPIATVVIEDNRDTALSVSKALEAERSAEFRVRTATTLKGGLEELAKGPTDVVLVDLHLPDAQGVDLIKAVKGAAPDIGVIAITGWPTDDIRNEIKAAGADALLSKPVDPSMLSLRLQFAVLYHRHEAAKFRAAVESTLGKLGDAMTNLADLLTESGKLQIYRSWRT